MWMSINPTVEQDHKQMCKANYITTFGKKDGVIDKESKYTSFSSSPQPDGDKPKSNSKKVKVKVSYLTSVAKQAKTAFLHGPTVWKSPIVGIPQRKHNEARHKTEKEERTFE